MALNLEAIKVIYFDIDNTLVDHSGAENRAIGLFFEQFANEFTNTTIEKFESHYKIINQQLWHKLAHRELTVEQVRTQRFVSMLQKFSNRSNETIDDIAQKMGVRYLENYGLFWELFDGASEVIEAASRIASLGLLSNGFREQVLGKVSQFKWNDTFKHIVISEEVGVMKPHREIFDHALSVTGYENPQAMLYIGDHYESDIIGAAGVGWQTVWVNLHNESKTNNVADAEIPSIKDCVKLLLSD